MQGNVPEHFRFFWRDWCSSPTIMGMTLAEQGAYLRLLCLQWEYGYIEDRMVGPILGLHPEEAEALLGGTVGLEFPYNPEGQRVNLKLDALRETALARSIQAQKASISRWNTAAENRIVQGKKRTRLNATKELESAIAIWETTHEPLSSGLVRAMELYRKLRSERAWPVWRKSTWMKNLGGEWSDEEWAEAYREATRSEWKSVHPRKAKSKQPFNQTKPSKFGGESPPLPPVSLPKQDTFVDPNTLWEVPDEH